MLLVDLTGSKAQRSAAVTSSTHAALRCAAYVWERTITLIIYFPGFLRTEKKLFYL